RSTPPCCPQPRNADPGGPRCRPASLTMSRLSILIPTWNAARFLPQLVPALRQQTLPPDEILIVDSGSQDDTVAIATSLHCRVMAIPNQQFRHGATRNLLALHAKYSRLVYLTQDV